MEKKPEGKTVCFPSKISAVGRGEVGRDGRRQARTKCDTIKKGVSGGYVFHNLCDNKGYRGCKTPEVDCNAPNIGLVSKNCNGMVPK